MLYGATGYSGALIAEEAVRRGHKPLLCGRSPGKLAALADRLRLEWVAAPLDDPAGLAAAIGKAPLVLHAAGPFIFTAGPVRDACLQVGAHYLDITGEINVFEKTFALDQSAKDKGIVMISGVGFDVVPTDCLAAYVCGKVKDPTDLEIAISGTGGLSAGTAKSGIEGLHKGGWVRRDGRYRPMRLGDGAHTIRFSHRELSVMPIPWGDLATAFRTTGVPSITTYMAFHPRTIALVNRWRWLATPLLRVKFIRRLATGWVERNVRGPSDERRTKGRSYVWARAANAAGQSAEAWLETSSGYEFTAVAAVRCVEKVLGAKKPLKGALTPALAFGADFVLEIEGTRRLDHLT